MQVRGIIFDKDGTLFDFGASWNGWAQRVIADLSAGDAVLMDRLAQAVRFDLRAGAFRPDSPVIAGTNREVAELLFGALDGLDVPQIESLLTRHAAAAIQAPAVPLEPLLGRLAAQGILLAVMTNDTEEAAHAHLGQAGVAHLFEMIIGFDSGHGAKPAPDPLLALATRMHLAPDHVVMVGDSTHDLIAGRAAGMRTVGVLTGMAGPADLEPLADVVLPDIGHLPGWLGL